LHSRRLGFDPWVWKIPGEGNGNPLQYSCLENPMVREPAWGCEESATTEQLTMGSYGESIKEPEQTKIGQNIAKTNQVNRRIQLKDSQI